MRRALLWGGSSGDSRGRPQFTGAGVKDSASDFLGRMERELVGFTREIQELGLRCRQQQPHIRALLEDRLNDLGVRRTVLARNIERLRTCRSDAAELGALTEKSYRELAAALRTARKWLS